MGLLVQTQKQVRTVPIAGRKNRCMLIHSGKKNRGKCRREKKIQPAGKISGIQQTSWRQGRHCRFPKRIQRKRAGMGGCIRNRKRRIPAFILTKREAWFTAEAWGL